MSDIGSLKRRVIAEVDAWRDELVRISDTIHANPELAFEEFKSSELLSETLEQNGFAVERGVAGLETAFVAKLRGLEDGPKVAFLAEYDALPGLGHACGHNIIGTAAIGAGLAMKAVLPELAGEIQVIGTPAEEKHGGKVNLIDAGTLSEVDAAMMVHPANRNGVDYYSLACYPISIEFFGKTAHASVRPEEGVNALAAMILTFNNVNAMRQHLRADARVHGIITHGGRAANIVPDYAAGEFGVRATDTPYATSVLDKLRACAEAAAQATGARMEFKLRGPRYDAMMSNPQLATLVKGNMDILGLKVTPAAPSGARGSSDMGNVSHVVPALHPYVAVGPEEIGAPHTEGFRNACVSPAGHEALTHAAKLMAMTGVDLLAEPENTKKTKQAFDEGRGRSVEMEAGH